MVSFFLAFAIILCDSADYTLPVYSVSQKTVCPLQLIAIFSLVVNLCN